LHTCIKHYTVDSYSNSFDQGNNMNINKQIVNSYNRAQQSSAWIDVINIESHDNLSDQYADICQQHELQKKWILMINPEAQSLEVLNQAAHIDTSKILTVNTKQSKIDMKNIASAFCKGNCSAVILCNPSLKNEELKQLNQYAEKGKTTCIVLNNRQRLH